MHVVYRWVLASCGLREGGEYRNSYTSQMTYGVLATFTFISGYFLSMEEICRPKDALLFYAKRLISFYPLYFMACILLRYIGSIENLCLLMLTLMGFSGLFPPAALTVWYLCMLMLFYLLTPLINVQRKMETKITIIVLCYVGMQILTYVVGTDSRYCFYWIFYGVGILLSGKVYEKINYTLMILAAVAFMVISTNIGTELVVCSIVSASCFIIFVLNLGKILEKTIILSLMNKISYASMCAYLFHRPIYWFIRCVWNKYIGDFTIISAYCVALPITLIVSFIFQYIYDKTIKIKLTKKLEIIKK